MMPGKYKAILLLIFSVFSGEILGAQIVSISQSTLVQPGSSVLLSCRSDSVHAYCSWTTPSNLTCRDLKPGTDTQCRREGSVYYNGSDTSCDIQIKGVKREHSGTWTCGVKFSEGDDELYQSTEVEVFNEADVDFKDVYGVHTVLAGVPVPLVCKADHSRPLGKFAWLLRSKAGRNSSLASETQLITPLEQKGLYNVEDILNLTLQPEDDGDTLFCTYTQYDRENNVLSRKTVDVDLKVEFLDIRPTGRLPPVESGSILNISVSVHGSPPPQIHWRVEGQDNYVLTPELPQAADRYVLQKLQEVETNQYLSTLTIFSVSPEDMENSYRMVVNSSKAELRGDREVRISVDRPWTEEDDPSERSPETLVIVIISVIIVLIIGIVITLTVLHGKKNQKWCFQSSTPYIPPEVQSQREPLQESTIIKHHPYGRPSS